MKRRKKSDESGVALVAVLGVLSLIFLLTATIVAVSQTLRYRTATVTRLGESVYRAESAANLAIWLLMNDKAHYPERNPAPGAALIQEERFLANGREHRVDASHQEYAVRIYDMYSGVDVSGSNAQRAFSFLDEALALDPARRELLTIFRNRLIDYIDFDDNLQIHGMERMDYEAAGLAPLPRNAALQYREELLWIPGSEEFVNPDADGVLRYINPIPPRGMVTAAPRPSLFSAPPELLRDLANLRDDELDATLTCLARLEEEDVTLEELFSSRPDLLEKLKSKFAVTESGFYTLIIRPAPGNTFGGRILAISLRVDQAPPQRGFKFCQWQIY